MKKTSQLSNNLARLAIGMLVLLPFHAFFTTWIGSGLGNLDVVRVWKEILMVVMAGGIGFLLLQNTKLRKEVTKDPLIQAVSIFIGYTLLQALIGANKGVELEAIFFGLILNLRYLIFMVFLLIISKETDLIYKMWKKIILVPAAIVVGFGLLQQFLLPKDFLTHFGYGLDTIPATHTVDEKEYLMRIQSTLRGPNPLGAYLVLVLTVVFNKFISTYKDHKITLFGILTFIVMFFTYSRSGLLGMIIAIFVLVNIKYPKLRKKILIVSGVFLTISLGGLAFFRDVDQLQNIVYHSDENSTSTSNQVRLDSMTSNGKEVFKHPFGTGVGSAGPASQRTDDPKIAENYYIQIAQEIGILGLVIYLLVSALVISGLWFRKQDPLALILIASFAGLTFINLISHAWTDDTISLIWWGLAGVALAQPVKKRTN